MGGLLHKLFYNNGPKDRQLFWRLGHFPPAPTVSVWPCPLPPVTLYLTWSGETKCTSTVWGTPSWLPYSTSLYLDFHFFQDKAERTQKGNLLIVSPVPNVGYVFVHMSSFKGRGQFKSMESRNSFDKPILKVSPCDCYHKGTHLLLF